VEKLIFESRPRFYVTADVYVPASGHAPYAAVLGVAGHSDAGKAEPLYQRGWISLAKRGYLVLAFDPPGQGERTFFFDPELGRSRVGGGTPISVYLRKALLPFLSAFGFCETLGDLRPLGECPGQTLRGENRGADLTRHVLRLTPPASSLDPTRIPRGKSFLPLRSCARPAGW